VAVSGRRADRLAEVVQAVSAAGDRAIAVTCDVTDEASVVEAARRVEAEAGGLDVVLSNAGFGVGGRVADLSDADWRRQYDVNVFGTLNVVRATLPALQRVQGRLALVGSVAAFVGSRKHGAYNSSKAAIRAIGETLSAELHGTGVSCTTLHPGFVESEIGQVDNDGRFDPSRQDRRPASLMWTAEDAARVMIDAIVARRREVVFTGHGRVIVALARLFPGLAAFVSRRI
ncbi:MAG TPA: SDR family NAD(P)-dependent oxidoreductase, partial [Myxococcota bacterium]|nr:SDR family NAD(P)-dependent oxidoreductase [Myxococcota bacterium]